MISRRKLLGGVATAAVGAVVPKCLGPSESASYFWKGSETVHSIIGIDIGSGDTAGRTILNVTAKPVFQILVDGVWQRLDGMKSMDLIDGADYDLRYDEVEIVLGA